MSRKNIELWGVKQNNLKNIDVSIPLGSFTVVCGPSGSGKSSLAFETLYAEGQRRYIESLSSYARQFLGKAPKPDVDGVKNIPPAIAIEQKNSVRTSRSTVGTATEVIDYVRLLFEKIGRTYCPTYNFEVARDSVTDAVKKTLEQANGERGYIMAPIYQKRQVASGVELQNMIVAEGFRRIYIPRAAVEASAAAAASAAAQKSGKGSAKGTVKKAAKKIAALLKGDGHTPITEPVSPGGPPCQSPEKREEMGEIVELPATAGKTSVLPDADFYIVVDRLSFSVEDEGRIGDSFAQAYHAALKFNVDLVGGRSKVLLTDGRYYCYSEDTSCAVCGYIFPTVSSQLFSFSSPVGACSTCNGFGNLLQLDESKIVPGKDLSISEGCIQPLTMPSAADDKRQLLAFCKSEGINTKTPWKDLSAADRKKIWNGSGKWYGVTGLFEYLEGKKYKMHVRVFLSRYKSPFSCPECHGARLRREANYVKVGGKTVHELSAMTIGELLKFVQGIKLTIGEKELAGEILSQLRSRLQFLNDVGVEYLSLNRPTKTISGGEYQRLSLAKQLGMGLSQTLYVLDEPTIGLHPRDNDRLIKILHQLNDLGNTLVVVEHDHDVIASSENIIEMGPGSGILGGTVVYSGETSKFYSFAKSKTAPYLKNKRITVRTTPPRTIDIKTSKFLLEMSGCTGYNLKNVDLTIPLKRFTAITGVSGSGKSSLITQTLYPAIAEKLRIEYLPGLPFKELKGLEHIKNVLLIDQSAIGKTARSNPVTYLKIYDNIRALMAATSESKLRGYNSGTFSLNVDGGRCPVCKGLGYEQVDMVFMDDVLIPCDACDSKKFRPEVLEVIFKGKNIDQILRMTVSEAMEFFVQHPNIRKPLALLKEVGLDYLQLGQPSSTLSGGESQRLKIARHLLDSVQADTLFILDEPTTGLHFQEVELLINVLNKLVTGGATVVVIEHNLDVVRAADYIIDLGPEAGAGGGEIVGQGTPEQLMKEPRSLTGRYLKKYLDGTEKERAPSLEKTI